MNLSLTYALCVDPSQRFRGPEAVQESEGGPELQTWKSRAAALQVSNQQLSWLSDASPHLGAFWKVIPCSQLKKCITYSLLLMLRALCPACLSEMGHSTQSTAGLLLSRSVLI